MNRITKKYLIKNENINTIEVSFLSEHEYENDFKKVDGIVGLLEESVNKYCDWLSVATSTANLIARDLPSSFLTPDFFINVRVEITSGGKVHSFETDRSNTSIAF